MFFSIWIIHFLPNTDKLQGIAVVQSVGDEEVIPLCQVVPVLSSVIVLPSGNRSDK